MVERPVKKRKVHTQPSSAVLDLSGRQAQQNLSMEASEQEAASSGSPPSGIRWQHLLMII
eukprot:1155365-Pelagomonas_calceolata.AAC.7